MSPAFAVVDSQAFNLGGAKDFIAPVTELWIKVLEAKPTCGLGYAL